MYTPKVSIVMLLYNNEKTIELALESVLMQDVNFSYEIIVLDDASMDGTLKILEQYTRNYKQIRLEKHKKSMGEAVSFYDALCVSKGEYFCVMNGDDYYTVKNKLQKQVDFLDGDRCGKYVAVTHKCLTLNSNFEFKNDSELFSGEHDWSYLDLLRQDLYSHASTYMYRNIFRNNVPEKFCEEIYSGNNPRIFMHMLYSKGKVKQLNFVGSAYVQREIECKVKSSDEINENSKVLMLEKLGYNFSSQLEKDIWNAYRSKNVSKRNSECPYFPSEYYINKLYDLSTKYAFKFSDFVFQQLYKSEFIDSFCESLGFIECTRLGYRPFKVVLSNQNCILITVSKLTTRGGGVFNEIKEIINIYINSNVYILWTDLDDEKDLNPDVKEELSKFTNLTCIYGQSSTVNKLSNLCSKIINIAPSKIYHYCGHNNVYLVAMIQSMISKNICVFSFDHGFSLGLDNTNYNTYITKRVSDYEILSHEYGKKVIYIPCWNTDKIGKNMYVPFKGHKNLITASAAARYYKLSYKGGLYIDAVASLLQKTGGKHIHYGPIPDEERIKIYAKLDEFGVDNKKFLHIPWANNLPESLLNECVDVFIEPFPTISYKITLEALSAGVPVITHKSNLRMEITDFIYSGYLEWYTIEDFIKTLSELTKTDLEIHSRLSRKYYEENHLPSVLQKVFTTEKTLKIQSHISFWDNKLVDMYQIDNLFNTDFVFNECILDKDLIPKDDNCVKKQQVSKIKRFFEYLSFKHRYKEFIYGIFLIIIQIPFLDVLIDSSIKQKLLNKIIEHYKVE